MQVINIYQENGKTNNDVDDPLLEDVLTKLMYYVLIYNKIKKKLTD